MRKLVSRRFLGFDILDISLFLLVVTLPWDANLNSRMAILFCLAGFFKNSLKSKKECLARNPIWVLPILFFLTLVASLFWDPNGIGALKSIEKRVSFFIFPLVIASIPPFQKKVVKTGFLLFILSVLTVSIACLVKAALEYQVTADYRVFFYQYLSEQMNLNAIYLSLYCIVCLSILLHYYFIAPDPFRFIAKPLAIVLYVFLSLFIVLLSSKMLIFLFVVLTIASVLYISYLKGMLLKGILLIVLFSVASGAMIWRLPYVRWRIESTLFKKYSGQNDNQNGLAVRQKLWETSVELITHEPVLGYGIRHSTERLVEEYKKDDFQIAAEGRYNSHNTYMQTLLNVGLLGFLPLAAFLAWAFITSIQRRNYLFVVFMTTILALGVTEAFLEVQKGIVFMMLFLFLFLYHSYPELNNTLGKRRRLAVKNS